MGSYFFDDSLWWYIFVPRDCTGAYPCRENQPTLYGALGDAAFNTFFCMTEVTGDAADDEGVDRAALDGGELGQGDLGAGGEVGVGDFHPALGFVDDVVEIIFERDAGHRFETLRWRSERAS